MSPRATDTSSFELAAGATARVSSAKTVPLPVFCLIDAVSLSLPPSHRDFVHGAGTFGSSLETGDELRFDGESHALTTAFLSVPELNGDCSQWYPVATMPAHRRGTLKLSTRDPFSVLRTDVRVFDPDGAALICVREHVAPHQIDGVLEVAPNFALLTANDRYCGWRLQNPIARLRPAELELEADGDADGRPQAHGQEARHLERLFQLVNEDTINDLYEGSDRLSQQLESLRDELASQRDSIAARAIRERIEALLQRWF
jgi:hypothetical protein